MDRLTVELNGITFNVVVDTLGEYPNITILEGESNPISFVEVNTVDKNIATVAYNNEDEDYSNKTIFRKLEE